MEQRDDSDGMRPRRVGHAEKPDARDQAGAGRPGQYSGGGRRQDIRAGPRRWFGPRRAIEPPAEEEPEQKQQRGEQDHGPARERDQQGDHRVMRRRGLLDSQAG